ncbi:uncharacterized protein KY384_002503 [Bacidia gigantensis]|uniref:uncharacterized protein n=1 Tax=Bacidia gigantensis TaxID=2732470 RepID=UPI001D037FDD|nr:uncharacterized protein KY384_002503 [Bacidia gigantensis]KAG8532626.1 hypothetical protein KY384_002503 [Bacidia gigantensis]
MNGTVDCLVYEKNPADPTCNHSSQNSILEANSVADIESSLASLRQRESRNQGHLDEYVALQKAWTRDLARLDLLRGGLGSLAVSTRVINSDVLTEASETAVRISSSVKRLDVEQFRVKSTLDVVEQVAELKACVLGVTGSMGAPQDWETAAGYLSRASKIPKEITTGSFTEGIVPTAEVPDPPKVTLENAAEALCDLFLREFEKAAAEGNGGKVTRFFKLFPLIGKPEVGLDVYGRYVCQGVASRARANLNSHINSGLQKEGMFYANALTKLFEHIAQIVESHGGLVERHYGSGRMVKVIERLQLEADVQGGIVLDTWSDEHHIDRTLTDIRSYAFTFLVQSFLQAPPPRATIPRPDSPAKKGIIAEDHFKSDEMIDMKEVNSLMSEMAMMLSRWSLYTKFIANKCNVGLLPGINRITDFWQQPENSVQNLNLPSLLSKSALQRKVTDRLVGPFNVMSAFFFRRSVEKAFQMDEQPLDLTLNLTKSIPSHPPYITSAVDDVMYIVNQVMEKTLATSQLSVITNIVPTIARILGSDFIGMIQRRMRDDCYPKAAAQGDLPPKQTTIAFLVLLNNLDVAVDYNRRIVESRSDMTLEAAEQHGNAGTPSVSLHISFPLDHDALTVSETLKSLKSSFDAKAFELIGDGIYVVFKNIMKPRLRLVLAEAFRHIDYQMTQEELDQARTPAEAETREDQVSEGVVQENFRQSWEVLTKPIARLLTERNFAKLISLVVSYLAEVLEKRIWSYYGRLDNLGAVRLERDVAGIASVAVRGGRYGLREAFTRCTQICIVMNMEDDEWEAVKDTLSNTQDSDIDWQLDQDTRFRARAVVKNRV